MAKGFRGGMGMGGNMSQVMAQAQRMQRQIEMAQAEIQEMRFTGTAGGELVKVTDGPFKGVEGRVARVSGQQRVVIALTNIGLISTAYIPTAFLESI